MEARNTTNIKVGICAMSKKVKSKPMKEILTRLKAFPLLEFIVFTDEQILNEPYENWPIVDCFISFYSTGFPLDKAIAYYELRRPFVLNDLKVQDSLQDRREVYQRLVEMGIETPRHVIFNRDENNIPIDGEEEIEEHDDMIIVKGHKFHKPFVEKPVDAEDHNIYIYYPSSAGGGCQILFRKVGNKSSVYSSKSTIRREGSYIYEDFMPTDGTDVKVYTIGDEYAHAEARKSPALDGKVDRDSSGKELRYPVILNPKEKLIAHKVTKAFKQTVCGFDLLRAYGKSFVCDVNGFSFVKTSKKYYDDCAQLLASIIMKNLAPQCYNEQTNLPKNSAEDMNSEQENGNQLELRCVVAIMRHGDRTPKQKMKMVVTHQLFFELFRKLGGEKEGRLKIKKPKHMQDMLDIVRTLVYGYETDKKIQPIKESKAKLTQMKTVLEMYGTFSGINRKVQIKAVHDERNAETISKLRGRNKRDPTEMKDVESLLVIVKWGGELTPMGKKHAEDLGRAFRCLYPGCQGESEDLPGSGLLRLHSSYKHDLKIYASDEGRVQMTAAAFAKGLLDLEGDLTPILVSLVKSNNYATGMLDTPAKVEASLSRVKSKLHETLRSDRDFTNEDIELLSPIEDSSVSRAMHEVQNPRDMCERVYNLVCDLVKQINKLCDEGKGPNKILYYEESLSLMKHRWEKLKKDFKNNDEFDISLIPDIYDCIKYDYLHNSALGLTNVPELYQIAKYLADIVIPQEYGVTNEEKLDISKQIAGKFFNKLNGDFQYSVNRTSMLNSGNGEALDDFYMNKEDRIRTRLYITSESHVHSVVNAIKVGPLLKNVSDKEWEKALRHLNNTSELNYLTQIVFMQYEDTTVPVDAEDRFRIEIFFSPGVKAPITPQLASELQEESLGNSGDYVFKRNSDLDDDIKLAKETREREQEEISLTIPRDKSAEPKKLQDNYATSPSSVDPINIYEASIIETLASLHPLVALHSSIKQNQMDAFLNEVKELDSL